MFLGHRNETWVGNFPHAQLTYQGLSLRSFPPAVVLIKLTLLLKKIGILMFCLALLSRP